MNTENNEALIGEIPEQILKKLSNYEKSLCETYDDPGYKGKYWAEKSEFSYEPLINKKFLVVVKVPCPIKDRHMTKSEARMLFVPAHKKGDLGSLIMIPKHYFKASKSNGYLVIQNFYLSAGCYGQKTLAMVDIQRKSDGNGREAFVFNYFPVDPEQMNGGEALCEMKLGTPKPAFNATVKISAGNGKFITIVQTEKIITPQSIN